MTMYFRELLEFLQVEKIMKNQQNVENGKKKEWKNVRIASLSAIAVLGIIFLVASPVILTGSAAYSSNPTVTKYQDKDSWAGYGINYPGKIAGIETNITVPSVTCQSLAESNFSVGIVDLGQPGTSAGVYAGCNFWGGHDYEVYGVYWSYYYYNSGCGCYGHGYGTAYWSPSPNDLVSVQILSTLYTKSCGNFTGYCVTITDITSSNTVNANVTVVGSPQIGVCGTTMETGLPQDNFGTASFTDCKGRLFGGQWKAIGSYASLYEFICYNSTGSYILSQPSALKSKMDFKVKFLAAGP